MPDVKKWATLRRRMHEKHVRAASSFQQSEADSVPEWHDLNELARELELPQPDMVATLALFYLEQVRKTMPERVIGEIVRAGKSWAIRPGRTPLAEMTDDDRRMIYDVLKTIRSH